jgi:transposase-like protein
MQVCPQCQSDRLVNNGSAAGKPQKQCQQCGYQFTRTTPRGKPLTTKINAVLLYLSGISMNRIAFLLRVSAQAVLNWIRTLAQTYQEKPEPTGRGIILERGLLATFGDAGAAQNAAPPQRGECHLSHLARDSPIPQLTTCRGDTRPIPHHRRHDTRH